MGEARCLLRLLCRASILPSVALIIVAIIAVVVVAVVPGPRYGRHLSALGICCSERQVSRPE